MADFRLDPDFDSQTLLNIQVYKSPVFIFVFHVRLSSVLKDTVNLYHSTDRNPQCKFYIRPPLSTESTESIA